MDNYIKDFLTFDEAADMLMVHRTTLYDWIRKEREFKKENKEPPSGFRCPRYYRIGSRYRFRKEDIENFINQSISE